MPQHGHGVMVVPPTTDSSHSPRLGRQITVTTRNVGLQAAATRSSSPGARVAATSLPRQPFAAPSRSCAQLVARSPPRQPDGLQHAPPIEGTIRGVGLQYWSTPVRPNISTPSTPQALTRGVSPTSVAHTAQVVRVSSVPSSDFQPLQQAALVRTSREGSREVVHRSPRVHRVASPRTSDDPDRSRQQLLIPAAVSVHPSRSGSHGPGLVEPYRPVVRGSGSRIATPASGTTTPAATPPTKLRSGGSLDLPVSSLVQQAAGPAIGSPRSLCIPARHGCGPQPGVARGSGGSLKCLWQPQGEATQRADGGASSSSTSVAHTPPQPQHRRLLAMPSQASAGSVEIGWSSPSTTPRRALQSPKAVGVCRVAPHGRVVIGTNTSGVLAAETSCSPIVRPRSLGVPLARNLTVPAASAPATTQLDSTAASWSPSAPEGVATLPTLAYSPSAATRACSQEAPPEDPVSPIPKQPELSSREASTQPSREPSTQPAKQPREPSTAGSQTTDGACTPRRACRTAASAPRGDRVGEKEEQPSQTVNSFTPDWDGQRSYVLVETPTLSVGMASSVPSPLTGGADDGGELDATAPSFGDAAALGISIEWPPPNMHHQQAEDGGVRWTKSTKGRPHEVYADKGNVTFQDLELGDSDSDAKVSPLQPRVRSLPGNTEFDEDDADAKGERSSEDATLYLEELGVAALAQEVTLRDLAVLRSFRHPPAVVCQVMEAAAVLLGATDTKWAKLRKLLDGNFLYKIRDFDIRRVTHVQAAHFNSLMRCSAFVEGLLEDKCPPAAALATWCRAVAHLLSRHRRQGGMTAHGRENSRVSSVFGDLRSSPRTRPPRRRPSEEREEPQVKQNSNGGRPSLGGLAVSPDLWSLSEAQLSSVRDLCITRSGVGSVKFLGPTDCRDFLGGELAELVVLRNCEVIVYPETTRKPPVGEGLNKPSEITLYGCMPKTGNFQTEAACQRYKERVRWMTEEKGADFIDYDCIEGIWRFRVSHF